MAILRTVLFVLFAAGALITFALSQTPAPEGRITSIFHDVQLLPGQADPRPAAIDDKVNEGSALRTGSDSRSELTFADLTITRLGANTIFSVNNAGRNVRLDSGTILLYAKKNSGGAQISTKAVTVGVTGTTLIFEAKPDSYDQLMVLEGDARFSLNNFPDQATEVRAGEILHLRASAKKLPKPGRVDLRRIVRTHPLITNFPPLPSLDFILAAADGRKPNPSVSQSQPQPSGGAVSQGGSSPVYVPNQPTVTGGAQIWPVSPSPTPSPSCWCCISAADANITARSSFMTAAGQVIHTTESDCRERGGECYGSRAEALKHCRGAGKTSTPTPTAIVSPKPTPRPNARPTGTPRRPNRTPNPPKKRWPPPRKIPTATPTPQIIR